MQMTMEKHTYIVGVTGGIGAGKSYVCQTIAKHGFPVYTSDLEARTIIDTNEQVRHRLQQLFGKDIYTPYGLDRKRVAQIVFSNPSLLQQMNGIVHPVVHQHFLHWTGTQTASMVFLESAILVSSGFDALCDAIVYITAPEQQRVQRVLRRDAVSKEDVLRRIANQSEAKSTLQLPSITLNNDETQPVDSLVQQMFHTLTSFQSLK